MDTQLFRKKSIEKITSPENLNEYIRVARPAVWMTLGGVIFLLAGVCVWGIFGRLDTKVHTAAVSDGQTTVCYITDDKISAVQEGMNVTIDDRDYTILQISSEPEQMTEEDAYLIHILKAEEKTWVYEASIDAALPKGTYQGEIITESVHPMSFITN